MPPQIPTHEISDDSNDDIDIDIDIDIDVQAFAHRGCCFWIPCFGSNSKRAASSVYWERIKAVDYKTTTTTTTDPWWTRGWKNVREWSEINAGPKWKTFIRTFRKNHSGLIVCVGGGGGGSKQPKFQYDPLSYSLNFDEGPGHNGHYIDEDLVARDFSSRFASVPASCHSKSSSIDCDKDAPLNFIK